MQDKQRGFRENGETEDNLPWSRRLSYVLFRGDGEKPIILAAGGPHASLFERGRSITDALCLRGEEQAFLQAPSYSTAPFLWIHSPHDVGVLDMRHVHCAGVGIYWRVHGEANGLGRLLNHGVLTGPETYTLAHSVQKLKGTVRADDVSLYPLLADIWGFILSLSSPRWEQATEPTTACDRDWLYEAGGLSCGGDHLRGEVVYGEELTRRIEKMARFVGIRCINDTKDPPVGWIRCHRPLWREICLFFLLTEASTLSADGQFTYRLSEIDGGGETGLSLELCYAVEDPDSLIEELDPIHRYLRRIGELHGMDLHAEIRPVKRGGLQKGERPLVCFYLDWLRDPTLLSSTDLKAGDHWAARQTEPFFVWK